MNNLPRIREQIADLLDVHIGEGQWLASANMLDREGKFTRKTIIKVLMAICQSQEVLEDTLESLFYQYEAIQKELDAKKQTPESIAEILESIKPVSLGMGEINPITLLDAKVEDKKPIGVVEDIKPKITIDKPKKETKHEPKTTKSDKDTL